MLRCRIPSRRVAAFVSVLSVSLVGWLVSTTAFALDDAKNKKILLLSQSPDRKYQILDAEVTVAAKDHPIAQFLQPPAGDR